MVLVEVAQVVLEHFVQLQAEAVEQQVVAVNKVMAVTLDLEQVVTLTAPVKKECPQPQILLKVETHLWVLVVILELKMDKVLVLVHHQVINLDLQV